MKEDPSELASRNTGFKPPQAAAIKKIEGKANTSRQVQIRKTNKSAPLLMRRKTMKQHQNQGRVHILG